MYLHIDEENNSFGFLVEGIHNIDKDKDIPITDEDYDTFFENQSHGTQYKLKDKDNRTSDNTGGLFDYVEEYVEQVETLQQEPSLQEQIEHLTQAILELM